jgi:hypothetical protein
MSHPSPNPDNPAVPADGCLAEGKAPMAGHGKSLDRTNMPGAAVATLPRLPGARPLRSSDTAPGQVS